MIVTTATNRKVRELLKAIRDETLVPRPEFQRRLVWTSKDKDKFIDSVVRGFPFPEVYLCNGDVNTETGEGTQLLVDGLQRLSTLAEYFSGDEKFLHVLTTPYRDLQPIEKERFLEYYVVVRDLGQLNKDQIIEVFKRLNSTQYTLRDMEVNNAIYDGALKKFCERFSEDKFFEEHKVFTATDRKRMGDVSFCLTIICTMMVGYFNRDTEHEPFLSRFNEIFPAESDFEIRVRETLNLINECGFSEKSRIWKKADFLTAFIEIDRAINVDRAQLEPAIILSRLEEFYSSTEGQREQLSQIADVYHRSALQASNDRNNRARRGIIVSGILNGRDKISIISELHGKALV